MLIQYRRRQPIFTGLAFLVLTAANIPVTVATIRIWKQLIVGWDSTSWSVLQEFFDDALIATLITLFIWLVVGLIAWAWLADRRGSDYVQ
ncbi:MULTISPECIES: hypothetical protein [Pandoraea]|uniref:Uncharacterized protein n=2 Tax=Pandoraea TaxID=93217 RepID=A0A5E4XI16_9BURK|nr:MULTISPECIES: hypothetical protein [Pandoraea]VVE18053.1 hypothetical protein PCE31107_03001 [Pandoraea cepalis]VVE35926.1 hypothetical protein PTE31013_03922 [Pandoraea terrigena]